MCVVLADPVVVRVIQLAVTIPAANGSALSQNTRVDDGFDRNAVHFLAGMQDAHRFFVAHSANGNQVFEIGSRLEHVSKLSNTKVAAASSRNAIKIA